ncbi:MAG: endonuclease/exonuclease/phosphatase family metal-dependent hydrolase [Ilumatobacter sp.]|jgi:endonuclease/exonuclease/phosphatase family metal-dependent hydrolase
MPVILPGHHLSRCNRPPEGAALLLTGKTEGMSRIEHPWTVTTWNLRGGAKPDIAAVATVIEVEAPDVVVIQEIRKTQATALASALGMQFTRALKHYPFTPLRKAAAEGMAILTPHALDAAGHSEISVKKSKWAHKRRIALWCLVGRSDAMAYRTYNVHLTPRGTATDRLIEAIDVANLVESHGEIPPAIVAGNFNDNLDANIIFALPGIEHIPPSPTSPAGVPTQTLDHVLLPAGARNISTTVPAGNAEWAAMSSHLPVTVRFGLE